MGCPTGPRSAQGSPCAGAISCLCQPKAHLQGPETHAMLDIVSGMYDMGITEHMECRLMANSQKSKHG